MSVIFIYQWICYRIDGSSYAKAFEDERLWQMSLIVILRAIHCAATPLDQSVRVICVLFVNNGKLFWIRSLFTNDYEKPPGMKLIGTARNRRKASAEEIESFRNKTKSSKMFKGYNTVFGNLSYVRDIQFTDYFMINTGKITSKL